MGVKEVFVFKDVTLNSFRYRLRNGYDLPSRINSSSLLGSLEFVGKATFDCVRNLGSI